MAITQGEVFGPLLFFCRSHLNVVQTSLRGDAWKIAGFTVYGGTLFALYLLSTLYHSLRGKAKYIFQKLDHTAIYLLIAGTYTPFTLITLRTSSGWVLFGIVWGLAIAGILQEILLRKRSQLVSVSLYVVMGWLALAAIRPIAKALPVPGLIMLIGGGLLYTVGVIFYALDNKLKYAHVIFHFFVLGGSLCHYFSILLYL